MSVAVGLGPRYVPPDLQRDCMPKVLFIALGLPIERPKCKRCDHSRPVQHQLTRCSSSLLNRRSGETYQVPVNLAVIVL